MIGVIDTERIKGNQIYLFSYQLYNDDFTLAESKTYHDTSIDLSNRHSPRTKAKKLTKQVESVSSFQEIYSVFQNLLSRCQVLITFSTSDVAVIHKNCRDVDIKYTPVSMIDLQAALFDLATDTKRKSNLKDYCKKHKIKHDPHIPESDCAATFEVYKNLLSEHGESFLSQYVVKK